MFIELTDHLRCPVEHDEAYLVLLPDTVERRDVQRGTLGCPVCGRVWRIDGGVVDFGDAPPSLPTEARLDGPAIAALVGVSGPGGFVALVGSAALGWEEVAAALPGVAIVAVNADAVASGGPELSVLRAGRLPLKSRALRGVVLGRGYGSDPRWIDEAMRAVLPGRRVVGEGPVPERPELEVLASAGAWWVGAKTRNSARPGGAASENR